MLRAVAPLWRADFGELFGSGRRPRLHGDRQSLPPREHSPELFSQSSWTQQMTAPTHCPTCRRLLPRPSPPPKAPRPMTEAERQQMSRTLTSLRESSGPRLLRFLNTSPSNPPPGSADNADLTALPGAGHPARTVFPWRHWMLCPIRHYWRITKQRRWCLFRWTYRRLLLPLIKIRLRKWRPSPRSS